MLYINKKWQLYKIFSFYHENKEADLPLFISEFDSIGELFVHILQSGEWYCTLSSAVREALIDCMQFVFFAQDDTKQSFKTRYQCYMRFHQQWTITYSEAVPPFAFEFGELAFSKDFPPPSDANEALLLSKKLKKKSTEHSIKQFEDCDNLAWWALREIIEQNFQIAVCKNCGCYFVKNTQHRKYCSRKCEKLALNVGTHAGEPEIKRLYGVINQRFERKKNSKSFYNYMGVLFDDDYNELELFSDLEDKDIKEDPSTAVFRGEHFKQIKETYKRLYKKRYKVVKDAKIEYKSGKLSEAKYKEKLDSFLSWLNNVVKQLDAFFI